MQLKFDLLFIMKAIPKKFYKLLFFIFIWSFASTLIVAEDHSFKMIVTLMFAAVLTTLLFTFILIIVTAITDIQIFFEKTLSHLQRAFKSK